MTDTVVFIKAAERLDIAWQYLQYKTEPAFRIQDAIVMRGPAYKLLMLAVLEREKWNVVWGNSGKVTFYNPTGREPHIDKEFDNLGTEFCAAVCRAFIEKEAK